MRRRNALLLPLLFVLVLVLVCVFLESLDPRTTGGLAYVFPSREVWDRAHSKADQRQQAGGIWHYNITHHQKAPEVEYINQQPEFESLADLSCNLGMHADAILENRTAPGVPRPSIYCTDISLKVLDVGRRDGYCPDCKRGALDISVFADADAFRLHADKMQRAFGTFRPRFDYVLVSDVLLYVPWGGWPPWMVQGKVICEKLLKMRDEWLSLCSEIVKKLPGVAEAQRRFVSNLLSVTRREIVFSNNQHNFGVVAFFENVGALCRNTTMSRPYRDELWHPNCDFAVVPNAAYRQWGRSADR